MLIRLFLNICSQLLVFLIRVVDGLVQAFAFLLQSAELFLQI